MSYYYAACPRMIQSYMCIYTYIYRILSLSAPNETQYAISTQSSAPPIMTEIPLGRRLAFISTGHIELSYIYLPALVALHRRSKAYQISRHLG